MRNRVDPQLPLDEESVREQRRRERSLTNVLAVLEGQPVGVASVQEIPWQRASGFALGWFGVLAEARRRGVGSELFAAASSRAAALRKDGFQVDLWEDEVDARAFFARRGFVEVERFDRVRLDLANAAPAAAEPPPGVELATLADRPDLVAAMFDVHCEAMADVPSEEPAESTFDGWRAWAIDRPAARPDLTIVAIGGGDLVGYASVSVVPGTADGVHDLTAVKRAWRRRGVALALKRTQIAAAKAAGVATLVTFNEMRNEPIRRLNERLGYVPLAPQLRLRGPLAP